MRHRHRRRSGIVDISEKIVSAEFQRRSPETGNIHVSLLIRCKPRRWNPHFSTSRANNIAANFFLFIIIAGEFGFAGYSSPVVRNNASYAGDNACARACAPQFVYLSQCVSIASECAKIITRNCEPRVAAFAGGCQRIIEAHPLSPGYLFYLSDNTPLWANRECGCAGNDWLFIITRGIRVISCARAAVKNRTPASVSRKIAVVFHRAFVYFIRTLPFRACFLFLCVCEKHFRSRFRAGCNEIPRSALLVILSTLIFSSQPPGGGK